MSTRKTIILASLIGAMTLPAFADNGIAFAGRSGEFQFHPMPSSVTRAQVQKELAEWRKNPVSADGYRDVGGEKGLEYVGHSYIFRDGRFVHADSLPHDTPKPSLAISDRERTVRDAMYNTGG